MEVAASSGAARRIRRERTFTRDTSPKRGLTALVSYLAPFVGSTVVSMPPINRRVTTGFFIYISTSGRCPCVEMSLDAARTSACATSLHEHCTRLGCVVARHRFEHASKCAPLQDVQKGLRGGQVQRLLAHHQVISLGVKRDEIEPEGLRRRTRRQAAVGLAGYDRVSSG